MKSENEKTIQQLFDLDGRVALVTGAASGGFASQAAHALAECGANVVVSSRDLAKAQQIVDALPGNSHDAVALDLTDEPQIQQAISRIIEKQARLDIVVNAAAAICLDSVESVSTEDFNQVLNANITGTMLVSRHAAPYLKQSPQGCIINFSSIYGVVSPDPRIYGESGLNSPLVYGASKAAIIQMTRYLSVYWAPDVRVNCISPGGLYNQQSDDFVEQYCQRTPLRTMAGPNDAKGLVAYLASDASAWVTGQNFVVDGGWTAW